MLFSWNDAAGGGDGAECIVIATIGGVVAEQVGLEGEEPLSGTVRNACQIGFVIVVAMEKEK